MYGDGPCVVLERAGPIDLAFLEGGHHLFVVNQGTELKALLKSMNSE